MSWKKKSTQFKIITPKNLFFYCCLTKSITQLLSKFTHDFGSGESYSLVASIDKSILFLVIYFAVNASLNDILDFVYCHRIDLVSHFNGVFFLFHWNISQFVAAFVYSMMHFCVNDLNNQYLWAYWRLTSVFMEIPIRFVSFRFALSHFNLVLNANIVTFCWPTKSFRVKCPALCFVLFMRRTVNSFILAQMCMFCWKKSFKTFFFFDWDTSKRPKIVDEMKWNWKQKARSYDTVLWIMNHA